MRTLTEERDVAWEEVSGRVGLKRKELTPVVALCLVVGVRVGVAVQVLWEMFVAAVKLVGRALRVVQEMGVWLMYL